MLLQTSTQSLCPVLRDAVHAMVMFLLSSLFPLLAVWHTLGLVIPVALSSGDRLTTQWFFNGGVSILPPPWHEYMHLLRLCCRICVPLGRHRDQIDDI